MTGICCSAPGKLFLGGEYAVLHGAKAVITAVDRRARAEISEDDASSRLVEATRLEVSRYFGDSRGDMPYVRVNSPRFRIRGQKVGLGSSAASCAAAAGAIFEWAGLPIESKRDEIRELAMLAHRTAQDGRGSGGDVAVAVMGGTLVFSMDGTETCGVHPPPHVIAIWTGRSASTTQLLSGVDVFERQNGPAHRACFRDLTQIAAALADAYGSRDIKEIVSQTKNYGAAMDRLGRESGVPIVTAAHKLVANLAAELGGGAKPSGAGGGDVAIAIFEDPGAIETFRKTCVRFDLVPLDLAIGAQGLRSEGGVSG